MMLNHVMSINVDTVKKMLLKFILKTVCIAMVNFLCILKCKIVLCFY